MDQRSLLVWEGWDENGDLTKRWVFANAGNMEIKSAVARDCPIVTKPADISHHKHSSLEIHGRVTHNVVQCTVKGEADLMDRHRHIHTMKLT